MKKICFNEKYGLQDATLTGRKTHTRRLIPQSILAKVKDFQHQYYEATFDCLDGIELLEQYFIVEKIGKLPFDVGDVVAVAQRYKDAGIDFIPEEDDEFGCYNFPAEQTAGWDNKMFVRADLMPRKICIKRVWFERLCDISDADCLKEGIETVESYVTNADGTKKSLNYYRVPIYCNSGRVLTLSGSTPREVYAHLIDRIAGKGTWASNPYVIAYEYELVK